MVGYSKYGHMYYCLCKNRESAWLVQGYRLPLCMYTYLPSNGHNGQENGEEERRKQRGDRDGMGEGEEEEGEGREGEGRRGEAQMKDIPCTHN